MKKATVCLCLVLILLLGSAQAQINQFYLHRNFGWQTPYENLVFGYSIDVFDGLIMHSDDELNALWDNLVIGEDDDEVYDFRYWTSSSQKMEFQIQVKEQTYASFEEELANAHLFISFIEDDMKANGYTNIRQLHPGIERSTPEGIMLETAYAFTLPIPSGGAVDIAVVYYDCYYQNVEYIFEITSYAGDYESAQYLLDLMVQTVDIWSPAIPFV